MPLLILMVLVLATLGFCGNDCQDDLLHGLREVKEVLTDAPSKVESRVDSVKNDTGL